ncbi:hypothetical protein B0H19DRAFT_235705 [Mycena capillaripes]|nr:hypothetical protein B0H19DRAFT_235705 [Mycena capillaripes]
MLPRSGTVQGKRRSRATVHYLSPRLPFTRFSAIGTSCAVDVVPQTPIAVAQNPTADTTAVDAPKFEEGAGEGDQLSDDAGCAADPSTPPTQDPAAGATDVKAPKVEEGAAEEEKPSYDCTADWVTEAPSTAGQDPAADTMAVNASTIEEGAGEGEKPSDDPSTPSTQDPAADATDVCALKIDGEGDKPSDGCAADSTPPQDPVTDATGADAKNEVKASTEPSAANQDVTASKPATTNPVRETRATIESPPAPPSTPEPPFFHNLPKLEEFISEEYFPDILYVNDPDDITTESTYYYSRQSTPKTQSQEPVPRKYKRVWPRFARDTEPATAFNTDFDCASIKLPNPPAPTPSPTPYMSPPVVPGPETNLRIAYLNLSSAPRLGVGNHSVVHRAALRLPRPLAGRSPTGEVTVAAKAGFSGEEARRLLHNEGKIYDAFPKHLMEDWCGLNLVAPITHPVPVHAVVPKFYGYYVPVREDIERAKQEAVRDWMEKQKEARKKRRLEARRAKARELRKAEKAKQEAGTDAAGDTEAVDKTNGEDGAVPLEAGRDDASTEAITSDPPTKVEEEDKDLDEDDVKDDDDDYDDEIEADAVKADEAEGLRRFKTGIVHAAWHRMSPILLLEECGTPISPSNFTADDRSECYSLALRLHYAEFTQNSFYVRNILRQPGPLTVAPSERSNRTPSFRIIDFGRGEYSPYKLAIAKKENEERRKRRWKLQKGTLMKVPTEEEMKARVADEEGEDEEDKEHLEDAEKSWWELRDYEVRKAHSELQIRDFNY